jgi:hypothetical protein
MVDSLETEMAREEGNASAGPERNVANAKPIPNHEVKADSSEAIATYWRGIR